MAINIDIPIGPSRQELLEQEQQRVLQNLQNLIQSGMLPNSGQQQVSSMQNVGGFNVDIPQTINQLGQQRFSMPQLEGLAGLIANPTTSQIGGSLLSGLIAPQQNSKPQVVELPTGESAPDGTPITQKFVVDINNPSNMQPIGEPAPRGSGVTVNTGQDEKPLSAAEIGRLRLPDGSKVPFGTTPSQAALLGARVVSTEEAKSQQSAKEAIPVLKSLADIGFGVKGEESLFPPDNSGVFDRGISGVKAYLSGVSQSSERITLYNSTKDAFLTGLARLAGQVGQLTDRDVALVRDMFPTAGFTPQSVAQAKFSQIVSFLKSKGVSEKQIKNLTSSIPKDSGRTDPPPPPGFQIDG